MVDRAIPPTAKDRLQAGLAKILRGIYVERHEQWTAEAARRGLDLEEWVASMMISAIEDFFDE